MDEEVEMFMKEFDVNQDGKVSWDEFINSMDRIKGKMDQKATEAREYTSHLKMTEDKFRHSR